MKKDKKYNYKRLSDISGEKINTLAARVLRMNIKGELAGNREVVFNKQQSFRIINYAKRTEVKNHPRKIEAVEMYIARMGIKNISNKLLISEDCVSMYAKEYRETGFLLVESSMNLNIIDL